MGECEFERGGFRPFYLVTCSGKGKIIFLGV